VSAEYFIITSSCYIIKTVKLAKCRYKYNKHCIIIIIIIIIVIIIIYVYSI